jgi:phage-related tail protein
MKSTTPTVTAHAEMADALESLLKMEATTDAEALAIAERAEKALKSYRIAQIVGGAAPFGSIIKAAIEALEAGKVDDAMKCLRTLDMATDYAPLVDLSKLGLPADVVKP